MGQPYVFYVYSCVLVPCQSDQCHTAHANGTVVPVHAIKARKTSRSTAPRILNLAREGVQ